MSVVVRAIRRVFYRLRIVGELLKFFWYHKIWWLIPLVLLLIIFGLLLIFAQAIGIAPFIYTLF